MQRAQLAQVIDPAGAGGSLPFRPRAPDSVPAAPPSAMPVQAGRGGRASGTSADSGAPGSRGVLSVPLSATQALAAGGTEWLPCSDRSRERQDPLWATGSRGLQWFLVEIDGAWGANAFISSAIGRELGQRIVSRVESAGMRPLAIRRTGRRNAGDTPHWRWAFVDSRPGFETVRWGKVDDPRELLDVPLDGSTGIHSAEPIYAVCTHAKHDRCCAVRGRPVVAALAAEFPAETWECSHLGGDRFAGTMAIFPEGLYYGRVDDADVVRVVRLAREGRVEEQFFRGRSSLTHPVQAAQHFARVHFGVDRFDAFPALAEHQGAVDGVTVVTLAAAPARPSAPAGAVAQAGAGAGVGVVEGAGAAAHAGAGAGVDVVEVAVAETLSQPLLSTCGTTRFGRVREFTLVSLSRA